MDEAKIRVMVSEYEAKSSYGTEPHYEEIKSLGESVLPFFIEAYPKAKRWKQRASFLYRAISYSRRSTLSVELGIMALQDRSNEVRYRACMLLACSLNAKALPYLKSAFKSASGETASDIAAAIDAIESENHNYFVDRMHSGKMFLNFEPS